MTFDDDYIGSESCFDLQNDNDVGDDPHRDDTNSEAKKSSVMKKRGKERVFPPPMPLLAQTENLASHMPWVMKRYYTSEGRLIIMEEKVKHHEYFRAHRSNGRLTLELVPLDDPDDIDDDEEEINDNDVRDHQSVDINNDDINNDDNRFGDEENEQDEKNENEKIVGGGDNGMKKFMNCNAFGVPLALQPIRTVRG